MFQLEWQRIRKKQRLNFTRTNKKLIFSFWLNEKQRIKYESIIMPYIKQSIEENIKLFERLSL